MPISTPVARLLGEFNARRPVRAWSLIVTLYGDAIVPRGGSLWLGSLIELMALFHIDAGHVRTAMSRLTADGWLERVKAGRNSYYRLSKRGQGSFAAATQRIYLGHEAIFDGKLRLALLGPDADRSAVRTALTRAGYVAVSPTTYVAVAAPTTRLPLGVFTLAADAGRDGRALAAAAWKLDALAAAYRAFIARFTPLDAALRRRRSRTMAGDDALVARTLLIHEFRRIVLRDPGLPAALLPPGWPGAEARALAARIYRRVVPAAEAFLDQTARNERGVLPRPAAGVAERFGVRVR
jgi:phenylacetic acid degradation operon negative regulatory protein